MGDDTQHDAARQLADALDVERALKAKERAMAEHAAMLERLARWERGEYEPWEVEVQDLMAAGKVGDAQRIILDHLTRHS